MNPDDTQGSCSQCHRAGQQLDVVRDGRWECSHVACPYRRQITAAPPPSNALEPEGSGCWRVFPRFSQD